MKWLLTTVAVAVLLTVGCSGSGEADAGSSSNTSSTSSTTTSSTSSTTSTAADTPDDGGAITSLVLEAPEGWATSADGLVVAEHADDLTGTKPNGPRVIDVTMLDDAGYAAFVTDPTGGGAVTRKPELVTVAGLEALAVTFADPSASGGSPTRRRR